nr:hypothetical protein [Sphingomonas jinjuensis]
MAMLFRHGQLVTAYRKGRALRFIGGLHFDRARSIIEFDAGDGVAGAVVVLVRNSTNAIGRIVSPAAISDDLL